MSSAAAAAALAQLPVCPVCQLAFHTDVTDDHAPICGACGCNVGRKCVLELDDELKRFKGRKAFNLKCPQCHDTGAFRVDHLAVNKGLCTAMDVIQELVTGMVASDNGNNEMEEDQPVPVVSSASSHEEGMVMVTASTSSDAKKEHEGDAATWRDIFSKEGRSDKKEEDGHLQEHLTLSQLAEPEKDKQTNETEKKADEPKEEIGEAKDDIAKTQDKTTAATVGPVVSTATNAVVSSPSTSTPSTSTPTTTVEEKGEKNEQPKGTTTSNNKQAPKNEGVATDAAPAKKDDQQQPSQGTTTVVKVEEPLKIEGAATDAVPAKKENQLPQQGTTTVVKVEEPPKNEGAATDAVPAKKDDQQPPQAKTSVAKVEEPSAQTTASSSATKPPTNASSSVTKPPTTASSATKQQPQPKATAVVSPPNPPKSCAMSLRRQPKPKNKTFEVSKEQHLPAKPHHRPGYKAKVHQERKTVEQLLQERIQAATIKRKREQEAGGANANKKPAVKKAANASPPPSNNNQISNSAPLLTVQTSCPPPVGLLPNKDTDAIFGLGSLPTALRKGSEYKRLVSSKWEEYAAIVVEPRSRVAKKREFVREHFVDYFHFTLQGRFWVYEADEWTVLNPANPRDLQDIEKRITQALRDEKKQCRAALARKIKKGQHKAGSAKIKPVVSKRKATAKATKVSPTPVKKPRALPVQRNGQRKAPTTILDLTKAVPTLSVAPPPPAQLVADPHERTRDVWGEAIAQQEEHKAEREEDSESEHESESDGESEHEHESDHEEEDHVTKEPAPVAAAPTTEPVAAPAHHEAAALEALIGLKFG